jgi:Tol biopolymer transport system component
MPALGGNPRRVGAARGEYFLNTATPQWSTDGQKLACAAFDFAAGEEGTEFHSLIEIADLQGGNSRRLHIEGKGWIGGDLCWSPDEQYFACVASRTRSWPLSRLWILRADDGEGFPVTDRKTWDWSPTWSRDGRSLYFVSNRRGSRDLWQQNLGEDSRPVGTPQRLTSGLEISYARFSPDGTKLAYSKGQSVSNVWRVPILKGRPANWEDAEQLTLEQARLSAADVSADGKQLVFRMDREGKAYLWVMDVKGGEKRKVSTEIMDDAWPKWSPDGKEIAFHSRWSGNRDIWIVPVVGGPARKMTQGNEVAWSPDGKEIAFSDGRSGNADIWIMPAQGGESRQLTFDSAYDSYPEWSPDGKWLLFCSNRTGYIVWWKVSATGGPPEPATTGEISYHWTGASWSSDGKEIYLTARRKIWAVSIHDGSERPVADLTGKQGYFGYGRPANDGQYIYFTWGEDFSDLWVMDVVEDE